MVQQINVKFGIDNITKSYTVPVTVATLRDDASLKAALGYGDNVKFLLDGVELSDSTPIPAGSVINVETRCNSKA